MTQQSFGSANDSEYKPCSSTAKTYLQIKTVQLKQQDGCLQKDVSCKTAPRTSRTRLIAISTRQVSTLLSRPKSTSQHQANCTTLHSCPVISQTALKQTVTLDTAWSGIAHASNWPCLMFLGHAGQISEASTTHNAQTPVRVPTGPINIQMRTKQMSSYCWHLVPVEHTASYSDAASGMSIHRCVEIENMSQTSCAMSREQNAG